MPNPVNNKAVAGVEKSIFAPQLVSQQAVELVGKRAAAPNEGIITGIAAVDRALNRHRPGELRVVLGYTSNYKSGLMNYIARYNANKLVELGLAETQAIITVTWEQSVEEQGILDISQLSQIDATRMVRGELSQSEWTKIKRAAVERGKLPWWLIGHSSESNERRPRLTMTDLSKALEYVVDTQRITPALIVLDYLQRIRPEGGDTRREKFIEIVDRAKDMALAFHAPVMLGSQAGREIKQRAWRLPQVDDGQESSNQEQSADSILSVWMPKNDYPVGAAIEYGSDTFRVDDGLLILGIMKQKLGKAPVILGLQVNPAVNQIFDRNAKELPAHV